MIQKYHYNSWSIKPPYCFFYKKQRAEDVTFNIALDVWHLMLGIEDNSLDTKRYLNILKSNFKQEYELGQNLFEISKEFSSPEQEPYIFSKILRTLLNFDNQIYYKTKNHTIVFY